MKGLAMEIKKYLTSSRLKKLHHLFNGTLMSVLIITAALFLTSCGSKTPENTVFSADDLLGKTIGVQLGTTGDIYVSASSAVACWKSAVALFPSTKFLLFSCHFFPASTRP